MGGTPMIINNIPSWFQWAYESQFNEAAKEAEQLMNIYFSNSHKLGPELMKQDIQTASIKVSCQKFLEWEEAENFRHTAEKEWLYFCGFKEGVKLKMNINQLLYDKGTFDLE
jgi:hypothetical protein